jgi:hypothetical protein
VVAAADDVLPVVDAADPACDVHVVVAGDVDLPQHLGEHVVGDLPFPLAGDEGVAVLDLQGALLALGPVERAFADFAVQGASVVVGVAAGDQSDAAYDGAVAAGPFAGGGFLVQRAPQRGLAGVVVGGQFAAFVVVDVLGASERGDAHDGGDVAGADAVAACGQPVRRSAEAGRTIR